MPEHLQHYVFGVRQLFNSDGTIVTIPNCTRKKTIKEMYILYKEKCKAERVTPESRDDFFFACSTASKTDQVILDSLDSVKIKCGPHNFDAMNDLINLICNDRIDVKSQLLQLIKEVQAFMHHGLSNHLNMLMIMLLHILQIINSVQHQIL